MLWFVCFVVAVELVWFILFWLLCFVLTFAFLRLFLWVCDLFVDGCFLGCGVSACLLPGFVCG